MENGVVFQDRVALGLAIKRFLPICQRDERGVGLRLLALVRDGPIVRLVRTLQGEQSAGGRQLPGGVDEGRYGGFIGTAPRQDNAHAGLLMHRDPVGYVGRVAVIADVSHTGVCKSGGGARRTIDALPDMRA